MAVFTATVFFPDKIKKKTSASRVQTHILEPHFMGENLGIKLSANE